MKQWSTATIDVTTLGISFSCRFHSYHQTNTKIDALQTHSTYRCWCPKTNRTQICGYRLVLVVHVILLMTRQKEGHTITREHLAYLNIKLLTSNSSLYPNPTQRRRHIYNSRSAFALHKPPHPNPNHSCIVLPSQDDVFAIPRSCR